MRRPRRNHSAAFKAKVALEAIRGEQPLADEEFASVQDGAVLNGIGTLIVVALWMRWFPSILHRQTLHPPKH